MEKEPLVKAAYCSCGKPYLLSVMPHAELHKDSIKEFKEALISGHKVKYITLDNARKSVMCLEQYGHKK